jgi:hypothetical protein
MREICIRRAAGALALSWMLAGAAGAAGAATVQVKAGNATPDTGGCGSGANPCNTIQAGVDNAATGDVVNVGKGDYAENVVVATPGIRIRGSGTLVPAEFLACPGGARTLARSCGDIVAQGECESAWFVDADAFLPRSASCFWNAGTCELCDAGSVANAACENACDPTPPAALRVESAGVTIEKLRVRAPRFVGIGSGTGASGLTVKGVRVDGAGSTCVALDGDLTTVTAASVRGCGREGVAIDGADSVLSRNKVTGTSQDALAILGPGAVIERNTVTLASGGGISAVGDGARVERNKVSLTGSDGVFVRGSAMHVTRNTARSTEGGVQVNCRAIPTTCADATRTVIAQCGDQVSQLACEGTAQVTGGNGLISCFWDGACGACNLNQETLGNCTDTCLPAPGERCADSLVDANRVIETATGSCLAVDATDAGLVALANQLALCGLHGVEVDGAGIHVERNTVTNSGGEPFASGFTIDGASHFVLDNVARGNTGDGFFIEETASLVTLDSNQSIGNFGDGFDVEEGAATTVLDESVATNNVGDGIEIGAGALGTVVSFSRASGNQIDFCDLGTDTTALENEFGSTGIPCATD